jgi:hypothetical protein
VADINDRLDRLHRREEFRRRAGEPAGEPAPAPVDGPHGGAEEALEAVARVVRRHPGLSVMVAVGDGRTGRPVIRVTERGGSVETVVVAGPSAPAPPRRNARHAADPSPRHGQFDGSGEPAAGHSRPDEPGGSAAAPDPSQVVSRLAQLLREDPTLASTWTREAQES